MIRNGKDITTDQHAQVCIIGSGPAGITTAVELNNAGLDVILLDGARQLDYQEYKYFKKSWPDKVLLYNGVADGVFKDNEPQFLIQPFTGQPDPGWERERVYGGTSTHWGGQSRPLDAITFEKRPGGFPGWPITREDLDPYYAKSVKFNHLIGDYGTNGTNFTAEFWLAEMKKQGKKAAIPDLKNFNVEMYQFMGDKWQNSATRTFDGTTIGDSSVNVIVNATVLNVFAQGTSVQYLNAASMNDDVSNPQKETEFKVTADVYILATGAVANARQLLLSGIGNDLVGHYFMCHPLSKSGIIQTTESYLTTPELNLMNATGWSDPTGNINGFTGRFTADEDIAKSKEIGRSWFWANSKFNSNQMYFEMTPNYDSFIELTKGTDQVDPVFGQQQTHIHWAFTDQDKKTYETNCELFNESSSEFPSIISWPAWKDTTNQWIVNGHHIGTTKMSASDKPNDGVVDQNLKIHGVNNMYVAGSSVFPSTGVSNPTMTIMALSLRLADHLKTELGK